MNKVVFISSNHLGAGETELGEALQRAFLESLGKVEPLPDAVIFMNAGVHLVANDAPTINSLRTLEASGVDILSCGTCLDYYNLMERVGAGRVSNMAEIVTMLMNADSVVSP
ncbi:sulfurtransferase-like selenium metabolism protein YedF [Gemmatimonadota bacterium]